MRIHRMCTPPLPIIFSVRKLHMRLECASAPHTIDNEKACHPARHTAIVRLYATDKTVCAVGHNHAFQSNVDHRNPPKSPPAAERSRHLLALSAVPLAMRLAAAHPGASLVMGSSAPPYL